MSFYKIRPRSGTKAQWETANTILAEREIGYELPDGGVGTGVVKMKMGDGVTAWNELPYASYVPDVPNDKGLTEVWNSETSYLANDYVIYDNKVWQALISNNGQTPAEGTYWTQVSLKGLNEKYTELNNSLDTIKIKTDQFTGVNTDFNAVYQTSITIDSRKVLSARCNVENAIVIPYYNNGHNLCFVIVNANGFTPYKNLSNVLIAYEYIKTI